MTRCYLGIIPFKQDIEWLAKNLPDELSGEDVEVTPFFLDDEILKEAIWVDNKLETRGGRPILRALFPIEEKDA